MCGNAGTSAGSASGACWLFPRKPLAMEKKFTARELCRLFANMSYLSICSLTMPVSSSVCQFLFICREQMCHLSVWDSLAASQEAFLVPQSPPSSPHVPCCTQTLEVVRLSPSRCDILLVPAVLHSGVYVGCSRGGKEQAHRHSKVPVNGFYLKLWKKYPEIQGVAHFSASQGQCWHQGRVDLAPDSSNTLASVRFSPHISWG